MRPNKPAASVKRAKRRRAQLSKPEAVLWQLLRQSPSGHKFRKQHPAGEYDLDFFHARSNLAIEVDGLSHDLADRPDRDAKRDAWLAAHRIDTMRIAALDVLKDAVGAADRHCCFGRGTFAVVRQGPSVIRRWRAERHLPIASRWGGQNGEQFMTLTFYTNPMSRADRSLDAGRSRPAL